MTDRIKQAQAEINLLVSDLPFTPYPENLCFCVDHGWPFNHWYSIRAAIRHHVPSWCRSQQSIPNQCHHRCFNSRRVWIRSLCGRVPGTSAIHIDRIFRHGYLHVDSFHRQHSTEPRRLLQDRCRRSLVLLVIHIWWNDRAHRTCWYHANGMPHCLPSHINVALVPPVNVAIDLSSPMVIKTNKGGHKGAQRALSSICL